MNDVAVLERAWLGFVGITDQVHGSFFIQLNEAPFQSARETRAAATAQSRVLDLVNNLSARDC